MRKASLRHVGCVCLVVLMAVALLCMLHPTAARADSMPIMFDSLGVLVPATSNDIRMTREVLTIDYSNRVANPLALVAVHARFWFRNEGKAVTQQMGFPLAREELSGFRGFGEDFAVTVDGAAVKAESLNSEQEATNGSELAYSMWNTFKVQFAAGQTRLLDVTYKVLPQGGYFLYVLQTGRLWKGPIGDLTIDANFGLTAEFPDLLSVRPAGYRTQGNHILWHLVNYEPEQDIEIESMDAAFWQIVRPLKEAAERTGTEADWYRYAMALLPDDMVGYYPGMSQPDDMVAMPQEFVRGIQSSAYADYVERTLLTALNHCAHGSADARILRAAYDARYRYSKGTGDFLDGVDRWRSEPSFLAHTIYQAFLPPDMSTTSLSPDGVRMAALLTATMAAESMSSGYSLNALHELEQSQVFARQAGIEDSLEYQDMMTGALDYISPYRNPRLLTGVPIMPSVEIQQQKLTTVAGGKDWRVRIILHQTLPPSEAQLMLSNRTIPSQPDWKTMPETDQAGAIANASYAQMEYGFSDTDPNDYLVILTWADVSSASQFQSTLQDAASNCADLLMTARAYSYPNGYPSDAAMSSSLQSSIYAWFQAIVPTLGFDVDHGITMTLNPAVPMSDALCDKAETELNKLYAAYGSIPWWNNGSGIGKTLQHNLELVKATRGKNPSVTTITYASDGTATKTPSGANSKNTPWIILACISCLFAGTAIGMLIMSRRKRVADTTPVAVQTDASPAPDDESKDVDQGDPQ
jgi:hypothetical protein